MTSEERIVLDKLRQTQREHSQNRKAWWKLHSVIGYWLRNLIDNPWMSDES